MYAAQLINFIYICNNDNSILMDLRTSILSIFALLFCASCAVPYYTQDTIPDDRIEFGYGESGAPIEAYAILKNGQVLGMNSTQDSFLLIKHLERADARALFQLKDSIRLLSYDLFQPSQSYMYITEKATGTEHELAWSKQTSSVPESLTYFFDQLLLQTVTEKKTKPIKVSKDKHSTQPFGW